MKIGYILLLILLTGMSIPLCSFSNLQSAKVVVEIPKDLARKYKKDAARLALRLDMESDDARFLPANIQEKQVDFFYKALVSVYTNTANGAGLAKCNIHTFPSPSVDYLVLIYNNTAPWAKTFAQGLMQTDHKAFGDLIKKYDLLVEKHVNWSETQDALTIRSRNLVNMAAIANDFQNIEGVVEIDLGIPRIEGNDIKAKQTANGWEFSYFLRFGALRVEKTKTHVWKYAIDKSGNANFVSEYGDPVPEHLKCHTNMTYSLSNL